MFFYAVPIFLGASLLLSATGPLLQHWFSRDNPGRSPYRLYALSNVASLLALLSYPVLFERFLRLPAQSWLWSGAYATFVLLCAALAWRQFRASGSSGSGGPAMYAVPMADDPPPTVHRSGAGHVADAARASVDADPPLPTTAAAGDPATGGAPVDRLPSPVALALWLVLPAAGSAMLLATTNRLTQDVAVVPFLWVLP